MEAVLRGKAEGAFVLHALTRSLPLDLFVLYSAAGLLLGAPGQGAYPAANAQLDALAHARRRAGLPALSVAWGAWAGLGMMAGGGSSRPAEAWAARGLCAIDPALGFARLEQLLREGATHAAVLPIDWPRFLAQLPAGADRGFFAAVAPSVPAAPPRTAPPAAGLVARLERLPERQRRGRAAGGARRAGAPGDRARGGDGPRPEGRAQGPRPRLAHGGGAAQRAGPGAGEAPPGDAGLRLPDAGGAGRAPRSARWAWSSLRRRSRPRPPRRWPRRRGRRWPSCPTRRPRRRCWPSWRAGGTT